MINVEKLRKRKLRHYRKNRSKILERHKKYWEDNNGRLNDNRQNRYRQTKKDNIPLYIWKRAKKRADAKNIDFCIDVCDIVVPEFCPILGIPLFVSDDKATANSPSLDRIDSNKGYVKGNVCVISQRANTLKNNGNAREHMLISQFIGKMSLDICDYCI